jgi:hypothetical protein
MKLQEFMNDDTCQILFAIIIGIVICYFIFGSSGSCNRDGFSVGGPCKNPDIVIMENACCDGDGCDDGEVSTCTQACADVYLPMHSDCLSEFPDTAENQVVRAEFDTLNAHCEETNVETLRVAAEVAAAQEEQRLRTLCSSEDINIGGECPPYLGVDPAGDILFDIDSNPCTQSCQDDITRWEQSCESYEHPDRPDDPDDPNYNTAMINYSTAMANYALKVELIDNLKQFCSKSLYDRTAQEHADDEETFNTHKKILMKFSHVLTQTDRDLLSAAEFGSVDVTGSGHDAGQNTLITIKNKLGINFIHFYNHGDAAQNLLLFSLLLSLSLGLTTVDGVKQTMALRLGDLFTPFSMMRGTDPITGVSQQKLLATSELGREDPHTISVGDKEKPEPLLMGLRYVEDGDWDDQHYGLQDTTTRVYQIFDTINMNVDASVGIPEQIIRTWLLEAILDRLGTFEADDDPQSTAIHDTMTEILSKVAFHNVEDPNTPQKMLPIAKSFNTLGNADTPLFISLTVDADDALGQHHGIRPGEYAILFGGGMSIPRSNSVYNAPITSTGTDFNSGTTEIGSVNNAALKNALMMNYYIMKILLDPGQFYPDGTRDFVRQQPNEAPIESALNPFAPIPGICRECGNITCLESSNDMLNLAIVKDISTKYVDWNSTGLILQAGGNVVDSGGNIYEIHSPQGNRFVIISPVGSATGFSITIAPPVPAPAPATPAPETPAPAAVPGCTNPTATNYDSTATTDDGTCIPSTGGGGTPAPAAVLGCTNPTATNYDSTATTDDGTCIPSTGGGGTPPGGGGTPPGGGGREPRMPCSTWANYAQPNHCLTLGKEYNPTNYTSVTISELDQCCRDTCYPPDHELLGSLVNPAQFQDFDGDGDFTTCRNLNTLANSGAGMSRDQISQIYQQESVGHQTDILNCCLADGSPPPAGGGH